MKIYLFHIYYVYRAYIFYLLRVNNFARKIETFYTNPIMSVKINQ